MKCVNMLSSFDWVWLLGDGNGKRICVDSDSIRLFITCILLRGNISHLPHAEQFLNLIHFGVNIFICYPSIHNVSDVIFSSFVLILTPL